MANLHAIQEILDDPSIKCKLVKDVRWLSHDMAIKAVIRTLPSLLVSLDREASQNKEPTAYGMLKFMKSYKFVAVLTCYQMYCHTSAAFLRSFKSRI